MFRSCLIYKVEEEDSSLRGKSSVLCDTPFSSPSSVSDEDNPISSKLIQPEDIARARRSIKPRDEDFVFETDIWKVGTVL